MAQHEELMKKTETMNIVMETDKILREEKERLKQDLQQMQAKVVILLIKSRVMLPFFII
jgi:nucleoprotein TPR